MRRPYLASRPRHTTRVTSRGRVAQFVSLIPSFLVFAGFSVFCGAVAAQTQNGAGTPVPLTELSLEELGNIEVTSVSKTAEPLSEAAAAIYVITHERIVRSGARSIPELLRLAPNLQVAQISANNYAITARGFNGTTANKLLVLIDGRSVYTPLYSGVFWDVQAAMPEDIDRIEVISGPGATLWGPNAVNGVINIITRPSGDTRGVMASVDPGNFENGARLRYGGALGTHATWRGYGMGFYRDHTLSTTGTARNDSWRNLQGGMRVDWGRGADTVTVQSDFNQGEIHQKVPADQQLGGHNLLGRWTRRLDSKSELQVQAYYDYSRRLIPGGSGDRVSVYDFDLQHSVPIGLRHNIVWGGGYRRSDDTFTNPPTGGYFSPVTRALDVENIFIQDTVALAEDLRLTLGTKFESNSYTGFAPMPSGRLSWTFSKNQLLWGAVSRAVRTPARIDRDIYQNAGAIVVIGGGPDFDDEQLTAYELGLRTRILSRASFAVSTFHNEYDALRSIELSPAGLIPATLGGKSGFLPITFRNKMQGHSDGVEVWGDYDVADWWRLTAGYNALRLHLRLAPDSLDISGIAAAGNDPRHQVSLRSSMDSPHGVHFDVNVRKVAALPNPVVPAYVEADARLGWQVRTDVELSLAGFNLLHARHPEFGPSTVPRHVMASVRWGLTKP